MERKYKVLIVDDEEGILTEYKDYLSRRGFIVEVAHDGFEGLEKLREGEFDVAIVDIKMTPAMSGIEMIHQAYDAGVDTDMIVLTGHGDRADAIAAIKVGVSDWFDKTNIDMDKFFQRVKELAEGVPLDRIERILSVIED